MHWRGALAGIRLLLMAPGLAVFIGMVPYSCKRCRVTLPGQALCSRRALSPWLSPSRLGTNKRMRGLRVSAISSLLSLLRPGCAVLGGGGPFRELLTIAVIALSLR